MNGMDFEIDVDRFREALRSQGIYDHDPLFSGTPVPSAASSYAPPATPQSAAPPSSESGSPPSPDPSLANQITSAILHATSSELPAALTSKVLSHLSSSPQLVTLLPSDLLSTSTLPALVDTNPQLARGLVLLTLAHGSKVQRKEVVSAFSYVPITLPALEIVNDVVLSKTPLLTYDEVCILVHEVLENGIRSAEAMGGLGAAVRGLDSNGMSPGGGAGGMAATRQAQSRHVKLLCLFIQSLLRNDVVDLQQLYYQIQDIGVKFMFVKEARELWRAYCANVDS